LLTSALMAGCTHPEHQGCSSCAGAGTHASAGSTYTVALSPAPTPYIAVPITTVAAKPMPAPKPPEVKEPEKETVQVGYSLPLSGGHEKQVKRRSFADITANPCFAHAPDYSSLTGELQFVHVRNVWTLRYASVDEEDRYGG